MGIADFYSVATKASPIGVAFNPDAVSSVRAATIGIAGCMLLLAINADELARVKPTHTSQVAKAVNGSASGHGSWLQTGRSYQPAHERIGPATPTAICRSLPAR